ncbi:MAG: CHRD domain-containing protein [Actinomycetota bacterium]
MRRRLMVVGALMCVLALVAGVILVSGAGAAGTRRVASLTGEQEVDPGPGDPDGTGRALFNLNVSRRRVCFNLSWRRIGAPTRAHIHEGRKGVAGGIVVTLFENGTDPDFVPLPGTIRSVQGCARDVERALIREIRDHPRRFYANIHNETFPAGAIRGQLRRP